MFQSARPVWDAIIVKPKLDAAYKVSIRASRVGRDALQRYQSNLIHSFNPRVPCGTRYKACITIPLLLEFQSARPVWDAMQSILRTL